MLMHILLVLTQWQILNLWIITPSNISLSPAALCNLVPCLSDPFLTREVSFLNALTFWSLNTWSPLQCKVCTSFSGKQSDTPSSCSHCTWWAHYHCPLTRYHTCLRAVMWWRNLVLKPYITNHYAAMPSLRIASLSVYLSGPLLFVQSLLLSHAPFVLWQPVSQVQLNPNDCLLMFCMTVLILLKFSRRLF
jgi:hypothetical protein